MKPQTNVSTASAGDAQQERNLWSWTALCALALFCLDARIPPCFNTSTAYIALVLLSLSSARQSFTYVASFVGTCLALLGLFLWPHANAAAFWVAAANRLVAVVAIWATAFLCIIRQRQAAREWQIMLDRENAERENAELRRAKETLAQSNAELKTAQDAVVYAVARVAEARDLETGQHLERIRAYSQVLAEELRQEPAFAQLIDDEFLANLYRASPLHDIGKLCIRDSVLLKQERLVPEEYELMKRHTIIGGQILEHTLSVLKDARFLEMGALVARCHHERFDGSGYPMGISGALIPLPARIVAVADVYDALVSDRPYRRAHSAEEARRMIENEAGRQFDPRVVGAFLRRFDDFQEVAKRYPSRHVQMFDAADDFLSADDPAASAV